MESTDSSDIVWQRTILKLSKQWQIDLLRPSSDPNQIYYNTSENNQLTEIILEISCKEKVVYKCLYYFFFTD